MHLGLLLSSQAEPCSGVEIVFSLEDLEQAAPLHP